MTLADACLIEQVLIHSGLGVGARFWKKNSLDAPFGYRFITIARSLKWGSKYGEISE
jgi:hypothetical protein